MLSLLSLTAVLICLTAAVPIQPELPNLSGDAKFLYGTAHRKTYADLVAENQLRRFGADSLVQPLSYLEVFLWPVDFGTPSGYFELSLETGTQQTFILDSSFQNKRKGGHYYNPSATNTSTKLSKPFRDSKWPLTVEGDTYQDRLYWAKSYRQQFGVVKKVDGFGMTYPADGVLGLAWPVSGRRPASGADSLIVATLLDDSKNWKYQLWFKGDSQILSMGGDKMSHKEPTYFPLIMNTDRPYIRAEAFDMGDFHVKNDFRVSFDTGYGALLFPASIYRAVLKQSKAEFDNKSGVFLLPCSTKFPELVFTFSGLKYNMRNEFLLTKVDHPTGKCVFPVGQDPNKEPTFTLGVPFFREYLIGFDLDNSKASLAPYWR